MEYGKFAEIVDAIEAGELHDLSPENVLSFIDVARHTRTPLSPIVMTAVNAAIADRSQPGWLKSVVANGADYRIVITRLSLR